MIQAFYDWGNSMSIVLTLDQIEAGNTTNPYVDVIGWAAKSLLTFFTTPY